MKHAWPNDLVGLRVYISYAARRQLAFITEDRGHIGMGGRQLVRVELAGWPGVALELPLDECEPLRGRRGIGPV